MGYDWIGYVGLAVEIISAAAQTAGAVATGVSAEKQDTAQHKAQEHQSYLDQQAKDADRQAALLGQEAQDARRKAAIASGGETLLTGQGGAQPQAGDVGLKTLLGG
jgi:hypothetical protein